MGIQGIGEYGNPFSMYKGGNQIDLNRNNPVIQEVPKPQEVKNDQIRQDISNNQAIDKKQNIGTSLDYEEKYEIVVPRTQKFVENEVSKNTDINGISLKFNASDDYSYIGKDKDINNLDMKKAISDMKKDSVLQEYQYFVGSSKNFLESKVSEDGVVIPKFDI